MSLSNFAFIADDEVVVTIDDKEEEGIQYYGICVCLYLYHAMYATNQC